MKKLFTLLLAVAASVGTMFAENVPIGDLYYNLDATNQTAEVTYQLKWDENNYKGLTTANIPASVTYNSVSYSVTSIGDYAFSECSGLTSVTIPNSVTSIGAEAFGGCTGLTSVTIPNSVTIIGSLAFLGCTGLTSVTIPNSVTSIGSLAFLGCTGLTSPVYNAHVFAYMPTSYSGAYTIPDGIESIAGRAFEGCTGLTSVTIPNSVTSIGEYAFSDCSSLTSPVYNAHVFAYMPTSYSGAYTIPDGIESIAGGAFAYCSGLTSVTIPNSVTSIGDGAFSFCTGLTSPVYNAHVFAYMPTSYSGAYTIPDGIESIAGEAFYNCTGLTSVTIPNSVTSIGRFAFDHCTGLTSLTIGNSVTSIGNRAFYECTGLTSVTIPNSVTSIGDYAFAYCDGLTSIDVASDNSNYCSVDGVLFNKDKTTLIQYPGGKQGAYTIPNSVTSIGAEAFGGCTGLTSVTIPNSVTSIGNYAFYKCYRLKSVTIPNSVTSIGGGAFYDCSGLKSVTIGNSVTSIGEGAFYDCSGLKSVTCFAATPPQLDRYVFKEVDKSIPLYVPAGSISAYKSANQWEDFTNILPIGAQPADVTTTTVTPSATTADIAWLQVTGAATYTIEIKINGELICTLTFNAQGLLISIASNAPSRNNAPQRAQAAGFSFTVISLDSGTTYSYTMTAKDNNGNVLKTESGTFTTTGDEGLDEISSPLQGGDRGRLIYHEGQIFILRGDKTYTTDGRLVR